MKVSEVTWEDLADRLILSAMSTKECAESEFKYPHIEKGSFTLRANICVGKKNYENRYEVMRPVTYQYLDVWNETLGITQDELFSLAAKNSKKTFPVMIEPLEDVLGEKTLGGIVLTNEYFWNGVSTMFYEPEVLSRIAENSQVDAMYLIVPSSNQVICIPQKGTMEKADVDRVVAKMTHEIVDNPFEYGKAFPFHEAFVYDRKKNRIMEPGGVSYSPNIFGHNDVQSIEMTKKINHR